ncbi:hypothetical protein [Methanococcus voltae]|uniref:Uncharacterized protein n=1 Tax=Methanococcus voltae (strain ATCC BAA-1334 / A3) TaxID=456320 RepID=D7DRB8_METV3|nr:hypothetical protein [Methanococcus voltae]MCS3901055.1 hypothetical protein [Methanococcus voltae]
MNDVKEYITAGLVGGSALLWHFLQKIKKATIKINTDEKEIFIKYR